MSDSYNPQEDAEPLLTLTVAADSSEQQAHREIRAYIDASEEELWSLDSQRNR